MFSSDITMSRRSLPLAYMASAGNQADLGLTELVEILCERPEVRAIGLHIEGLSDIPAFERAALKALRAGTPIVALKTGRSEIGEALPENMGAHIREAFIARGVAPMQGVHETLNAIRDAAGWTAARARILTAMPGALVPEGARRGQFAC